MLSLTDKFPEWKDFPKGLHVLVVDKDNALLSDVKSKLEAWDYTVTTFNSGEDALGAFQDHDNNYHAVLLEAPDEVGLDSFKILEAAQNVPTIMISDTENMAIMMQSFALGASEFLQKPVSDEKLKNIWQHVARKAMSTGKLRLPDTFLPVKTTNLPQQPEDLEDVSVVVRTKPLTTRKGESPTEELQAVCQSIQEDTVTELDERGSGDLFASGERLSAPATPQLQQAGRINSPRYALEDSSNSDNSICIKPELDDLHDGFITADRYAEVRSELYDVFDESSHSCDLLDLKTRDDDLGHDEFEQFRSELYPDFQFDDKLDLDDDFNDFTLSSDLSVDGNVMAELDLDSNILEDMSAGESLNMSIDCLHDAQGQEADFVEEEALLLAEVAKAEKEGMLAREKLRITKQLSRISSKDGSKEDKKEKNNDAADDQGTKGSKNAAAGKRKMKVDWTPELHRRFVQAVEQLGVDKAIPSRILELMGVQCLTRHNIASHLQKYRSHRKHLLARETEAANWNNRRHLDTTWARTRREGSNSWATSTHHSNPLPIQPRPPLGLTPIQLAPPLHVWGHPTVDHPTMHMWQKPHVAAAWQAPDGTFWQQPTAFIDAWGHPAPVPGTPCYPYPIMRLPLAPMPGVVNMAVPATLGEYTYENIDAVRSGAESGKAPGFHPPKEAVDAAINEVLKDPWTPLPLGLKPPSLESVMVELQRQGIASVPMASS